jgi:TolA-binding protein
MRRLAAIVLSAALLACSCQEREANKRIEAADDAYRAGHYDEARRDYQEILRRWPDSSAAIRAEEGLARLDAAPVAPPSSP